jgi:hypothetical protein
VRVSNVGTAGLPSPAGLRRKDFAAVRHEVPVTLVWGFDAGHFCEACPRQVTVWTL